MKSLIIYVGEFLVSTLVDSRVNVGVEYVYL